MLDVAQRMVTHIVIRLWIKLSTPAKISSHNITIPPHNCLKSVK